MSLVSFEFLYDTVLLQELDSWLILHNCKADWATSVFSFTLNLLIFSFTFNLLIFSFIFDLLVHSLNLIDLLSGQMLLFTKFDRYGTSCKFSRFFWHFILLNKLLLSFLDRIGLIDFLIVWLVYESLWVFRGMHRGCFIIRLIFYNICKSNLHVWLDDHTAN